MDVANPEKTFGVLCPALFLMLPLLVLLVLPPPAWPQIYRWTDERGVVQFSDSPPGETDAKALKTSGAGESSGTSARPSGAFPRQTQEKRSYQEIKVIMYMTDWCPYCRKAKEFLVSLGVDLVEYNIERDREARWQMAKKGGRGVPLIDVEGIFINGYSPEMIREAVEKRRTP
jgi:glutaredoxin